METVARQISSEHSGLGEDEHRIGRQERDQEGIQKDAEHHCSHKFTDSAERRQFGHSVRYAFLWIRIGPQANEIEAILYYRSFSQTAILVAHSPEICPYMADENMASTPGVEASNNSTAEYMNYVQKVQERVDKLRSLDSAGDWTPHKVELALWAHYQIKQYNSTLIEAMPVQWVAGGERSANEPDEASSLNECSNGPVEQRAVSDENQVGSSEIDLNNCNLSSNLVSSNKSANDEEESSQHGGLNNGHITQSDNESVSNSLSSTSFGLVDMNSRLAVDSNQRNSDHPLNADSKPNSSRHVNSQINSSSLVEEDASNLSSAVSSNSEEPSVRLNKVGLAGEEDSSSNNVSSTNGINQAKANSVVSNGNDESNNEISNDNEANNNESSSGEPKKVGSSLIKQHHFQIIRPQVNVDSNLSLPTTNDSSEKFSTISSSCENSSNNVNSSEDSLLLANSRKRRTSSSSNSLSNLKSSRTCAKNCNADALDLNLDDNAVAFDPDSEQLTKRQKLIN